MTISVELERVRFSNMSFFLQSVSFFFEFDCCLVVNLRTKHFLLPSEHHSNGMYI